MDEDSLLRSVTLRNADSIQRERQRAERELVLANEALELRTQELELLNRTGVAIASTHDLRKLVQTVTDAATQLTGAEFGAFFYSKIDEKGVEYQPHTLAGSSRAAFDRFSDVQATSLFEATFRGEGTVRCDDVQKHPRYGKGELIEVLPRVSYLSAAIWRFRSYRGTTTFWVGSFSDTPTRECFPTELSASSSVWRRRLRLRLITHAFTTI